jgi:hypothetical protein
VKIICPIHGEFEAVPGNHMRGCECAKCASERRGFNQRQSRSKFIERSIKIHGLKYNYKYVKYVNVDTKIVIKCKKHGKFEQTPYNHIQNKRGCPICSQVTSRKLLTTKQFIEKAKIIHGDKYHYNKVRYINNRTCVSIICKRHGKIRQTPKCHLKGSNCPKCADFEIANKLTLSSNNSFYKLTLDDFIKNAQKVHGNRYNYKNVNYINGATNVIIICSIHGKFQQTPNSHVSQKCGCPKCSNIERGKKLRFSTKKFIELSKNIHGDRYDYSKVRYIANRIPVIIICKIHGEFKQAPHDHYGLDKCGCQKCGKLEMGKKLTRSREEFIKLSKNIHGKKYNYNKVKYINGSIKVIIVCSIHGDFKQTPHCHLSGCGCGKCKTSKGEQVIVNYLDDNCIDYNTQKTFENCKDKKLLKFDFYIEKWNLCIEYDGEQHFKEIKHFGGAEGLENTQKRDKIKDDHCEKNDIGLIRIRFDQPNPIEYLEQKIIKHRLKLLEQRLKALEENHIK